MQKKLVIIDANSLIHRAFHALPPFKTKEGELVNAVFGFCSMIITILSKIKPDFIATSFDVAKKTFRHKEYEAYKATRKAAPDGLYIQFGRIREILEILEIPIYEKEGYEADDLLATISEKVKKDKNVQIYIVTGDQDAMQLVTENVSIFSPKKVAGENLIYNPEEVKEKFGLTPDQIIDYKALRGDVSDNIPGVPGIGEKTAVNLLQTYGNLENIYKHLDEIKGAVHDKLEKGKENAIFSKKLVTLVKDVPIDFNLEDTKIHPEDLRNILPLFDELQFRSLIPRLKKLMPKIKENPAQTSLF